MNDAANGGYTPVIQALLDRGHGKTSANEIVRSGVIKTFLIGRNRFVKLSELAALPDRMQDPAAQAKLASARYPRRRPRVEPTPSPEASP